MKKICFFFALLWNINLVNATIPVTSVIDQVTVFRNGAQIKRVAKIKLLAGQNEVIIKNLPAGFDESTIIVNTKEKTSIADVSYKNNFSADFSGNAEYTALLLQLKNLEQKKENENLIFETWKEEESLLLSNKKVSGESTGLTAAQLTAIADLYRTRLLDIKQKMLDSKRKIEDLNKDISKTQSQINEWTSKNTNQHSGEIYAMILSNTAMDATLLISYIDYRASWQTSLDLRLDNLQQPLTLVNKGKVSQSTGEEWKNVNFVLSTGNPGLNTKAPIIAPWFLYYLDTYLLGNAKAHQAPSNFQNRARNARSNDGALDEVVVNAADSRENITFMEHSFAQKMTIPSDKKYHEVTISENNINANYRYLAIPKLDNKTYLMANITEWDQYNLSSGEVKLYFEGTYIGETYLNVNISTDTLSLSLGPDIAIASKREQLKDYKKTKFLSSKKEMQVGYELTIKNNKSVPVEIDLKDQVPLTTDADTEIEVEEISDGKLNKETGLIDWKLTLKPGEQVKKRLIYKVKIPKEKNVAM